MSVLDAWVLRVSWMPEFCMCVYVHNSVVDFAPLGLHIFTANHVVGGATVSVNKCAHAHMLFLSMQTFTCVCM